MRRLLSFFLLLLLPVQLAFAAAAPYCATEKVEVAAHFGHHEHADDAAPAPAPDEGKDGATLSDECGVCHLGSVQTPALVPSLMPSPDAARVHPLADGRQPQHLQKPAERPPRSPLA